MGRTLVDPSGWKVPVLVSNFSQETVVVNPFTEVGMITQVTAIQSVADDRIRPRGVTGELPHHLQDLVDQTSDNLDGAQRRRLTEVLLEYADIFPVPGDPLTGHTDAVEHDINTGDRSPIRCAPRRMSPQKMKKEEDCVTEMLTGGQIEASDSLYPVLCRLSPTERCNHQRCLSSPANRRHLRYAGGEAVVFDPGFG